MPGADLVRHLEGLVQAPNLPHDDRSGKFYHILEFLSLCILHIITTTMMTLKVSCSYAFMLPVATAPNAIVFGASTMRTADMMK